MTDAEIDAVMRRDERLEVASRVAAAMAVAAMDRHWSAYQLGMAALEIADALIEQVDAK